MKKCILLQIYYSFIAFKLKKKKNASGEKPRPISILLNARSRGRNTLTAENEAVHQYGWLCKQDEQNHGRQNRARSRVTIIYLPARPEGRRTT